LIRFFFEAFLFFNVFNVPIFQHGFVAPPPQKIEELIDEENSRRSKLSEVDDAAFRLEHPKDGGVFWSIVQSENTTRVRWGKIGESGNYSEKEHKVIVSQGVL
jgi:hypothetical protein